MEESRTFPNTYKQTYQNKQSLLSLQAIDKLISCGISLSFQLWQSTWV